MCNLTNYKILNPAQQRVADFVRNELLAREGPAYITAPIGTLLWTLSCPHRVGTR